MPAPESGEPGDALLPFLRLPAQFPIRSLDEVLAVCRFMGAFPGPWWIGGGWAIDIWAGAPSREHEDIEICVLRDDQPALQAYCTGWQSFTPVDDQWAAMGPGEMLEFPRSMWQLRRAEGAPPACGMPPEFEFILNDVVDGRWLFRHDPEIQVPFERIVCPSPLGLPVAASEVLLLHKAWYTHRQKDDHDFRRALPLLGASQRAWLHTHLARLRPDDSWLAQLR